MPVNFLTQEQEKSYGKYTGNLSREELERYFYLDEQDQNLVNTRRGDHNKLGFAIQICTARFLGNFLENPVDVPSTLICY